MVYEFNFPNFTNSASQINIINGGEVQGAIHLTESNTGSQFGAAWFGTSSAVYWLDLTWFLVTKVHVDSFNTSFTLFMENQNATGVRDGIAFVIQDSLGRLF